MTLMLERTLAHGVWATGQWWARFEQGDLGPKVYQDTLAELCHLVIAEEVWLSRIEGRELPNAGPAGETAPFWPAWDLSEARQRHAQVSASLLGLVPATGSGEVRYTDTSGHDHRGTLEDLLLHVSIHGQFHRGRASARLRAEGQLAPVGDYIVFVREGGGAPSVGQVEIRKMQATWGRGTLDNQAAESWLEDFVAAPSDAKLHQALSAGSGVEAEACAVAAAEVVAARASRGKPGLPPRLLAWSLGHSAALEPELIRAAVTALVRIEREGALAGFWKNEGGLVPWRRGLEALRERLTG